MAKNKIKLKTQITRYTKKKGLGNFSVGVGDIKLTDDQRNRFDDLIDEAAEVFLTIEPVEEKLPGMD